MKTQEVATEQKKQMEEKIAIVDNKVDEMKNDLAKTLQLLKASQDLAVTQTQA